mgnify:CR=1 FL=1
MKNITLSADETTIERARAAARRQGRSLNDMVRAYLEALASTSMLDVEFDRLQELSDRADGHRRGASFSRDDLHDRS